MMIVMHLFSLVGLASAGLLFTKKYSQPLVLDQDGYVEYKFYNIGERAVELVSLSDYTFLRSLFVSPQMTNIELETYIDRLQIEGNETRSLKVPIKPMKSTTFHDLPAKLVYHVKDDASEHTSWSSVNGKVVILNGPVKEKVREEATGFPRINEHHAFWLFSSLTILLPAFRYQRIVKYL